MEGGAVGYLEKSVLGDQSLVDELLAVSGLVAAVQEAMGEALEHISATMGADPRTPGNARCLVDETLRRWDCGDLLDVVTLLVSEAVTNAVVHAGTGVEVGVSLRADAVRVEVFDSNADIPDERVAADRDESGRGLALVEAMASAWGVEGADRGKTVVVRGAPGADRGVGSLRHDEEEGALGVGPPRVRRPT